MSATGISAIRYFSFMNEWLDFVVTVPDDFVESASQIIKDALDQFWDDQYETYGDAVETELAYADIPFEMKSIPWDDKRDCPVDEQAWESWIEELNTTCPVTTIHS